MLSVLCDRFEVTKDESLREKAANVFAGLKSCVTVHGVQGFVARNVCTEDAKSTYINSSRDQVTHFVHGLWQYFNSPLPDEVAKQQIRVILADVAERLGVWFHVDGAYGGAGLAAPSVRARYTGIERADSYIVDPHKWLFAPFDCCALLYRNPAEAKRAHTQHAEYLDVLHGGDDAEWNPSDYAHHLSRRARGLPLWFSLATHGTDAYRDAVEETLLVAHAGAALIAAAPHLELIMEPDLSVVLFRRVGWDAAQYQAWSDRLLDAGIAFVTPTGWQGETLLRICVVNPRTTVDDIALLVDSLA